MKEKVSAYIVAFFFALTLLFWVRALWELR